MEVGDILWRAEHDGTDITYFRYVVARLTTHGAWLQLHKCDGAVKWVKKDTRFAQPTPVEALEALKKRMLGEYTRACQRQRQARDKCLGIDIPAEALEEVERAP